MSSKPFILASGVLLPISWFLLGLTSTPRHVLDRPILIERMGDWAPASEATPARWSRIAAKFRADRPSASLAGLLHHAEAAASLPYHIGDEPARARLLSDFLAGHPALDSPSAEWIYRDDAGRPRIPVRTDAASESHPAQILATCAAMGVPGSRIVRSGSTTATVAELVGVLRDEFHLEGEVEWKVMALARYAPTRGSWRNRWGRSYDFDRIAGDLIARRIDEGSCHGTHILQALATLLRVDTTQPILSARARAEVRRHLEAIIARLDAGLRPGGCWAPDWATPHPNQADYGDDPLFFSDYDFALVTGHHMEWLDMVRPELDVSPRARAAAIAWCADISSRVNEAAVREHVCAYNHCFRVASRDLPTDSWNEMAGGP